MARRSKNRVTARRIRTGNSFENLEGFNELRDLLLSLAERSESVYEEELEKAANMVMQDAKSNVHSKSGQIAGSIKLQKRSGSKAVYYKILAGGIWAPHAHLVEFGHRLILEGQTAEIAVDTIRKLPEGIVGDVPAHPFLRKAFEENKSNIESALNTALDKLLKEV